MYFCCVRVYVCYVYKMYLKLQELFIVCLPCVGAYGCMYVCVFGIHSFLSVCFLFVCLHFIISCHYVLTVTDYYTTSRYCLCIKNELIFVWIPILNIRISIRSVHTCAPIKAYVKPNGISLVLNNITAASNTQNTHIPVVNSHTN